MSSESSDDLLDSGDSDDGAAGRTSNDGEDIDADLWLAAMYGRTGRQTDAIRAYAEAAIKAKNDPRPVAAMVEIAVELDDEGAELLAAAMADLAEKLDEQDLRANLLTAIEHAEPAFIARTLAFASRHQKRDHAIALLLAATYSDDSRIRFAAAGVLERKAKTVVGVMARLGNLADFDPSEKVRDLLKEYKTDGVAPPSDDGPLPDYSDGDLIVVEDDDDDADYL